jgi:arylsulfatase A-like enzyme
VEENEHLTTAFGREACAFITRHKDRPFFLYLAFNAVHCPVQPDPAVFDRLPSIADEKRRKLAALALGMDDAVGEVLKTLRANGLEKNTLVFFLSDNGAPITHNAPNGSRNDPLRGGKGETWEGGVRVPFLVQWPAVLPAGATYRLPIIQLDAVATALTAAGAAPKPEWKLDGVDLVPFLKKSDTASPPPHEALYWRLGREMAVVDGRGEWKLVTPFVNTTDMDPPVKPDWLERARLFHLASDIGEANDTTADNPAKSKELASLWDRWNRTLPPAGPTPSASEAAKD